MGSTEVILLDTQVLVWVVSDPERLSRPAASAIRRARVSDGMAVSAITLWELAMLFARGKLERYESIEASVSLILHKSAVVVKPISVAVATLAAQFPPDYPRDPADRLIGATARAEGIPLLTRDERIRSSPLLNTIW
ncbi:MAG TPA: type II toxin-antitoxin system VapC family toxin [Terriglobales bacterium]